MEQETLLNLQNNNSIMILPADKGNTIIVLSSKDYHNKMKSLVDDPVYRRLMSDPAMRIEKQTASLLRSQTCQKKS
jgi:hypothetical protein